MIGGVVVKDRIFFRITEINLRFWRSRMSVNDHHHPNRRQEKHVVHWFRKGLRFHDNPSLRAGLAGCTTFRCIFILDPWFAGSSNVDINKWRYLFSEGGLFLQSCLISFPYYLKGSCYSHWRILIRVCGSWIQGFSSFVVNLLGFCQSCSKNGGQHAWHLKKTLSPLAGWGTRTLWPCAKKWTLKQ